MSEMHELIIDSTTKILKDKCTKELVDTVEKGVWPEDLWNVLVESGITTIAVPDSIGGTGGDYIDAFHILRLAGKFSLPLPLAETLITNWLLADQGESPLFEPLTFSMKDNTLEIEQVEEAYLVNGTIENVPWGRFANKILVIGQMNNQNTMALLPLEKAEIQQSSNLAGEPMDTVIFDQVKMDLDNTYQIDKDQIMKKTMLLGALAKAVMMSGALEKALDLSIQYAKEREQFGRPLFKLQVIQQYIATIAGETVASLTISNKAISAFEQGSYEEEVANAKLKVNESAGIVSEIAHQVHGAIGVTHEHQLHQLTRRLWSWREDFGDENHWAEQLANRVLNNCSQSLWEFITRSEQKEPVK
ncbi:hypothetical protein CWR48_13405 [Oceanobacillus arenosus]|uniref:Acyl-CoA dehydrogenase n=1 Tax=Oceanobacillus arenosus TaxID=1229153 RepID=A0A3D8PPR7_9BACI|nr:acyl-CoA dehydrogenase family protein [Oceanobacillus arenosus]RDW17517.1 hypothetical protein CWR48_13405 [Oceanobacillus arenosus]